MPEYGIAACLGNVQCELTFYTLVKLDGIESLLVNVDQLGQNILVGLIIGAAVIIGWNILKSFL
jgi:hypothetical protein